MSATLPLRWCEGLHTIRPRWNARQIGRALSSKPGPPRARLPTQVMERPAIQEMLRDAHIPKDPVSNIRTGWFWISGLAGFCIAIYSTSVFYGWRAAWKKSLELHLEQDGDVSNRYDELATGYDDVVDLSEKVMLLVGKRKSMCRKAKGHVLEVSAGTGRNVEFYNLGMFGEGKGARLRRKEERIRSINFVDQSPKMLDICSKRWKEHQPDFKGQVLFTVADAGAKDAISPPVGTGGFDTIVQTFGLCSITKPVEYMRRMKDLLREPGTDGSEGGRILLLEHGRGHYWWINYVLDGLAKEHADRFGCWWNRDIGRILEDSGLKVVGLKRYNLGTTWVVELTHPPPAKTVAMESKKAK